ncbi:energy transducer TonB [Catenovulum maritimum]|uniref:Protein TonB n=1 Tax=Catenovulum maritimum TaxID=1513271 RepID=A0A0J8GV34_9ALTE|nr:energy transducer TonB [Catenovulum maritimum]KMT66645.1 hypothetical protein XM47_00465 [Catenovulum maritimum]
MLFTKRVATHIAQLLTLALYLTFSALLMTNAQAKPLSQDDYIHPKPIERIEPKYPSSALRKKQEGWVRLSFFVNEQGNVVDIKPLKFFGVEEFKTEAELALREWKYKPALKNGVTVKSKKMTVELTFLFEGKKILDLNLKKRFLKINKRLENNELDEAKAMLADIDINHLYNLTEQNFYHNLSASYAQKTGNIEQQLSHLNTIKFHSKITEPMFKLSVLKERFIANIKLNKLSDASRDFRAIKRIKEAKPYLATFEKILSQAKAMAKNA